MKLKNELNEEIVPLFVLAVRGVKKSGEARVA